jgi:hypothetical protein
VRKAAAGRTPTAATTQRLAEDLRELRQRAGAPSYSTLEKLSNRKLWRATMSNVLNGNWTWIPDWGFVEAFVNTCRAFARGSGPDLQALRTLADWKQHWDLAATGVSGN